MHYRSAYCKAPRGLTQVGLQRVQKDLLDNRLACGLDLGLHHKFLSRLGNDPRDRERLQGRSQVRHGRGAKEPPRAVLLRWGSSRRM